MLSHRRFSRPVLSTTQPSLRVKKQFSRQTRVLYYHARGTLSTKRPARNLKKTKNRACKPAKTVVFLVGCLRKLHIRVWRSLVSRLNGVQEASSSNLDTRTKGSAFSDESASFFIPDLAFLLFFDIISLKDKSGFVEEVLMCKDIQIKEERISSIEYIEFLKRTDLGSQYPKERFEERIAKLVDHVSISLVARNRDNQIVGVLFGLTDYAYWLYVTDLGVDRDYLHQGIGTELMETAHSLAGGKNDIAVYLVANESAIPFYKKLGMRAAEDVMEYNHIEWTPFTVTQ